MQGELGYRKQTSGLRLCRGTTHLNLQHVYGLRLLDGDGLGRQHSDQDPFWRGREVTPASLLLSKFPHGLRSTQVLVRPSRSLAI